MIPKFVAYLTVAALLAPNLATAATPATVAEAARKLDLETLPLPAGAETSGHRRVAELTYSIKQPTKQALAYVDKQLTERGWQQLPGGQQQDEFANADYQIDGYTVHVSISPREPGVVRVMLTHQGNVALEDVPVPDDVEKMYAFPGIAMYKSPRGVKETAQACRERMLDAGWSPYGGAGDTEYYRQNAVQVDLNVMSAPGQGGATVISVSSHLLSLEIPAPPFADGFRYSDGTTAIGFDTDKTPQEVADYYREQLKPLGWKATTDEPVAIKWKQYTIFRNASQEMITIATHDFEGRTRVNLDHQNASEVAHDELRGKIAAGEKAKYRDLQWLPVDIAIPTGQAAEQLEDWAIKIPTATEDAFAAAEAIAEALIGAGWASDTKDLDDPVIRLHRLAGQDRVVYVIAIQPPKLQAWVGVVGIGGVKLVPK